MLKIHFFQVTVSVVFLSSIYFHLAKRNIRISMVYGLQSAGVVALLFYSYLQKGSPLILVVVLATLAVKVIIAPTFFIRLINRHKFKFAVDPHVKMALGLAIIGLISGLVTLHIFSPLTTIIPANQTYLTLALASMLISVFLIANHKDALSQIVGILSLENSIVVFAIFAGLDQSSILDLGILFDIFVWLFVAIAFISMMYRHIGSIDVTRMKRLKD
jgi:hydrogenase-4 component E